MLYTCIHLQTGMAKPSGPAQGLSPKARVRTPPGLLPTALDTPRRAVVNPARGRAGAPLQAWIHIQHPRKLPALFRPVGGY